MVLGVGRFLMIEVPLFVCTVKGYLDHKKQPPRGFLFAQTQGRGHFSTMGSWGGTVPYARGTPVNTSPAFCRELAFAITFLLVPGDARCIRLKKQLQFCPKFKRWFESQHARCQAFPSLRTRSNPKACPLNPTPSTLNPQPSTLNPQSSTLLSLTAEDVLGP